MPSKLKVSIFLSVASVVVFWVSACFKDYEGLIFQLGLIFLALLVQNLVDLYQTYPGLLSIIFRSTFLIKRMRISFAYLIRVPVGDDYLLVKNERFNLYQPPGGVFECYDESVFDKYELVDDEHLKKVSKFDLRKMVTKPRLLGSLVIWFLGRKNREVDPHREFTEELLDSEILSKSNFYKANFEYLKTEIVGIKYSSHFKCEELKIFEIYELRPSESQRIELDSLSKEDDRFKILSKKIIERDGFCTETNNTVPLGDQTKYIIWKSK